MDIFIKKSALKGKVTVPPSKSLTHRLLIGAALGSKKMTIENPLICSDTMCTLKALQNMGVKIEKRKNKIIVHGSSGKFERKNVKIFLKDSGTSLRLLLAISALSRHPVLIDGSPRLARRPIKPLLSVLKKQGAKIRFLKNKFSIPLLISGGNLKGGCVKIPGNISSQFISGLLLISPFTKDKLKIHATGKVVSKGYISLTKEVLKIMRGRKTDIKVEGDFSSASYFLALNKLSGSKIIIKDLNGKSVQPDSAILKILKKPLNNTKIDISNCPDIALTLGILGPAFGITLTGTDRLKDKESDRAASLIFNLRSLGTKISEGKNFIKIEKSKLHSGVINTFNDHRVAMSFAVLGATMKKGLIIKNAEVVNKSYPAFFKDLKQAGANLTIIK